MRPSREQLRQVAERRHEQTLALTRLVLSLTDDVTRLSVRSRVIERVLVEKLGITQEDVDAIAQEVVLKMAEQAKERKEAMQNGSSAAVDDQTAVEVPA